LISGPDDLATRRLLLSLSRHRRNLAAGRYIPSHREKTHQRPFLSHAGGFYFALIGGAVLRKTTADTYLRSMFKAFAFCLPTNATKVPAGPEWLHEIKHDGFRSR
jgi:ATP-dependent DNA ligase